MDPVDGDQVYAAEQLLKSRKRGGKTEYFVKWKGWGAKYNTWEPAENILDERLIQDFEKRHPPRVATKRASEGTAPTTPVPKRGRASKRGADKEETPESSSAASTSASARAARSSRRSRRGDSATSDATTEEKIDEEPAAEKEAVEDKKKEPEKEAEVEKKVEAKAEEKAEAEEPEEKTEEEQPAKQVSEETQDEPEEEDKSAEDEPEKKEDKEEDLSLNLDDSANTTAEEAPEAAPKAPMEIYVEKTVNGERNEGGSAEAAAAPAINGDAQKEAGADNGKEAFVITNADDPNCTHKIQVIHAATEGTAAETSRDDSSDIEYVETVQKKETVTETVRTEGDDSDDCVVLESTTTETTVTESVVGPTASTEQ